MTATPPSSSESQPPISGASEAEIDAAIIARKRAIEEALCAQECVQRETAEWVNRTFGSQQLPSR